MQWCRRERGIVPSHRTRFSPSEFSGDFSGVHGQASLVDRILVFFEKEKAPLGGGASSYL
jgi:hypothetical protein